MRRVQKVALLLDASRSFDRGLLRGISQYVNLHCRWTVLRPAAFYQRFMGLVEGSIEEITVHGPDGIIMNYSPLEEAIQGLGIPMIVVPVASMVEGARHLLCDNRAASELAADHLAGLGLRHFAFAGFDRALWSSERSQHFCRRLAELGHAAQTYLVPLITPELEKPRQEAMLVRWLKNLPKPVGIMACNDDFGRSLAEMCRLHGLRVPDDVALIGVDNDELICELSSPPLSSISFAVERAGYEAAELLDQLMAGKKPAIQSIAVPVGNVVARQSTNVLAIHDDEVIKALRFIRDNADRIIEVSDVVDATLLSHRTLHNRFRRALGHSLVAEMNQQRAAHIAQLLLGTNDSVGRIARAMGYYNAAHLSRFFRREMGITPRAYRLMRQGRQEFATGDRSARELAGRPARRGAGRGGRGRSQKSV